jgi:hypothetical protein
MDETTTPKIKFVFKGRRDDQQVSEDENIQESPSKLKIRIKAKPIQEVEEVNRKRKEYFDEPVDKKFKHSMEQEEIEDVHDKIAPLRKTLGSILNNIIKLVFKQKDPIYFF